MSDFYFFLENDPKGGPWDNFFHIFGFLKPYYFACIYLLITATSHNRLSIQLDNKENFYLELECGPAQPYLFSNVVWVVGVSSYGY